MKPQHVREEILALNERGLLAEVLGFETTEVALKAYGAEVTTYSGRQLLDFTGGIAVHACGHNHPAIVTAIQSQAGEVLHVSDIMRHSPQLKLAEFLQNRFCEALAGEPFAFLFMNSGSESIDAAAKLAQRATGRSKFISFKGAFHGRTMFASALSHSKTIHWHGYETFLSPLRSRIFNAPAPRCQGCSMHKPDCCIQGLEQLLEAHKGEVAAIFFEAQQGEGGYFPLTSLMAHEMQRLANAHDALLIADEIQTGCGRTGKWFGFEHLGLRPDIVVLGKAIGGGLPLAAVAATQSLMGKWTPGEHGTTFGGNPVACAAGLAAMETIANEHLVDRARELGEKIKARLSNLVSKKLIADVRGNGLMLGIELRYTNGHPDYDRCERVKTAARERDLLLLTCGARVGDATVDNSTIRLIPPLNIAEEALWKGITILEDVLSEQI